MTPRHVDAGHLYLLHLLENTGMSADAARRVIEDADRERLHWRNPTPRHRADQTVERARTAETQPPEESS